MSINEGEYEATLLVEALERLDRIEKYLKKKDEDTEKWL